MLSTQHPEPPQQEGNIFEHHNPHFPTCFSSPTLSNAMHPTISYPLPFTNLNRQFSATSESDMNTAPLPPYTPLPWNIPPPPQPSPGSTRKDLLRRYLLEILAFTYSVDLSKASPSHTKLSTKDEIRLYTLSCAIHKAKNDAYFHDGHRIPADHRASIRHIIEACLSMHLPPALVLKHLAYYRRHRCDVKFVKRTSPYRSIAWFGRVSVELSVQLAEDVKLVHAVVRKCADKTPEVLVKEGIANMMDKYCKGKVWSEKVGCMKFALKTHRYEALVEEVGVGFA
ncbi:hypothetical protein P154DRAFT_530873 [Amniculicola lignicola CBS 123094]|uniref:Uncharacterized protein n=1 Tax=Amniculicola lignicola CBS 123094 TaxID=1392246 RepID=A0A6A5X2C2_9PLEO|nr:hypothetical protein P154DRAFT_530873 [Amniculicola lignicola CBS 123094]